MREKSRTKPFVQSLLEEATIRPRPTWIEFDPAKCSGKLITLPERSDLPFDLNEQAIIEFYSRKL